MPEQRQVPPTPITPALRFKRYEWVFEQFMASAVSMCVCVAASVHRVGLDTHLFHSYKKKKKTTHTHNLLNKLL